MAKTYGDEACRDFQSKNPFLSHIIWPEAQVPVSAVRADMEKHFQDNRTYASVGAFTSP